MKVSTINFIKKETPTYVLYHKITYYVFFLNALFTKHLRTTASDKTVFIMFYSLKSVLRYNKIIPGGTRSKIGDAELNFWPSSPFYWSLYILGWISNLYQKELSKIYSMEQERLLGILMVGIIVKEKNNKKFLTVYFHLRFSITSLW